MSDLAYKEAGGKWGAAGDDPFSECMHDRSHLNIDQIKGHRSSGRPCPIFDELQDTASKTFFFFPTGSSIIKKKILFFKKWKPHSTLQIQFARLNEK